MRRCAACAAAIDDRTEQCPRCGARSSAPDAETSLRPAVRLEDDGQPPNKSGLSDTRLRTLASEQTVEIDTNDRARSRSTPAVDSSIGHVVGGRYEILSLLGVGGMGRVYKVRHVELDKILCLKKLKPELADSSQTDLLMSRFRAEAKTTSRLNHPNIIKVLDFGADDDGALYYVMDCVEGRDLDVILAEEFALSDDRTIHIVAQVLDALAEAHSQRIVHRDLKPKNIMIEQRRSQPDFVHVLDFGIAKALDQSKLTQTGHIVGTAHYMSPEQALGGVVDTRSDLYSVGVMLYELSTGVVPYDAESPTAVLFQHVNLQPQRPRARRAEIPERLEDLILRALEKSPDKRPQTAEAFRAELLAIGASLKSLPPAPRAAPSNRPNDTSPEPTSFLEASTPPPPRRSLLAPALVGLAALVGVAIVLLNRNDKTPEPQRAAMTLPTAPVAPARDPVPAVIASPVVVAPTPAVQVDAPKPLPAPVVAEPARAAPPVVREEPPKKPTDLLNAAMARIQGGLGPIGCDGEACEPDEQPFLQVTVAGFRIDRTEVPVAAYAQCVDAAMCTAPREAPGCLVLASDDRRPINCVTWEQAADFCRWRGARLPTEFEWERAARGAEGREFPWGGADPDCSRASYKSLGQGAGCGLEGPAIVGSRPGGASPEGVQDLAGNVWEWTADLYGKETYANGRPPSAGSTRVVRGGSYDNGPDKLTGHFRLSFSPTRSYPTLGFRCVK